MTTSQRKPEYGSDLIVDLLTAYGIEYAAFNPGSTFRGLHDSLVNYGGNCMPNVIECAHEEISVAIAHGYAKAAGRPMAALVHNIVGLQHASMAIYNAWCDRVPVLVLGGTGPMDITRRRPWIDWVHTALIQGQLVRDYVKWDDQPHSHASIPDSFIRAYRLAVTPPQGPVYLCYDVELQETPLAYPVQLPDPGKYPMPTNITAEPQVLSQLAQRLVAAERPVILADYMGRTAAGSAALLDLAELLAIPVLDAGHCYNFPTDHSLNLTGNEKEILNEADLVLALDMEDLFGALHVVNSTTQQMQSMVNPQTPVVHISLKELATRAWTGSHQRLYPLDTMILADPAHAVSQLVLYCRQLTGQVNNARRQELAHRHRHTQQKWQAAVRLNDGEPYLSPSWLADQVWQAVRKYNWSLVHGNLKGWAGKLWRWSQPEHWLGHSGGAGLGYGMGAAIGAAMAWKDTDRLCINLQPDGDFLMTPQALWTAAHHQIPLLTVMYNNRSYFNSENHSQLIARRRQRPLANAGIGTHIDNPPVDYAMLARSMGVYGEGPVTLPEELEPALLRAIRVVMEERRPALVDVVTSSR